MSQVKLFTLLERITVSKILFQGIIRKRGSYTLINLGWSGNAHAFFTNDFLFTEVLGNNGWVNFFTGGSFRDALNHCINNLY